MKYSIFVFLGIFYLSSCTTSETIYEVGDNFLENDIQVKVIDTFSIQSGIFKLDSLITSGSNRILVGNTVLENYGRIYSKSYLELATSSYEISNDAVYDSIVMVLNYDNYSYGDTTKVQKINLHRVLETFEPEDGIDFYNTSSLVLDDESLGEITFMPTPNISSDSLFIKIDDVLGEEIFSKIEDNDINTTDDFLQYFKGIALVSDETTDSNILGFNALASESTDNNSSMRLYYTIPDDDSEDNSYYLDFVITSDTQQFNQINLDLSNTSIGDFSDSEEIKLSENYGGAIFSQGGTGITSRIEIPTIKNLTEISNNATSLEATLTFRILEEVSGSIDDLPETLLVYVVDHKNRVLRELTDIDGVVVYAQLTQDESEFNQNTYYTIDLGGFVEEILSSELTLNYALMLQFTDYNKEVNSLFINNASNSSNQIKLSVTYLNY